MQAGNFKTLLKHLFAIRPVKDYSDEMWHFYTPSPKSKKKWLYQSFVKYQDTIYWTIHCEMQLEFDLKKGTLKEGQSFSSFRATEFDIPAVMNSCIKTLKKVRGDWVGYHRWLLRTLPKQYRFGLVQRRILWDLLSDLYRPDLELPQKEYDLLMKVFDGQERLTSELALPSPPSLNTYLEYCRVGYLANLKKNKSYVGESKTGMEMYKAMADGRDEGLMDIPVGSPEALVKWYHSGRSGGHPWEICRGGNTTHIDLGVYSENDKWFIFLNGNSTGRMLETSRMALAFHKLKMPFRWFHFKDVRLKMEGRDNIGIIPEYHSLHRANQLFEEKDQVFDCLYLYDLGRAKRQIDKFITFLPLEPLYPWNAQRK